VQLEDFVDRELGSSTNVKDHCLESILTLLLYSVFITNLSAHSFNNTASASLINSGDDELGNICCHVYSG